MNFKLGDFVRFVDEKREGYVTRIIDAQTLGVTDTDGFEIPVAISNLTHVHGHQSNLTSAVASNLPVVADENFKDSGIFIAVAEDSKLSAVAHLSLINETSHQLLVTLKTDQKGIYKGEFASVVQAKTSTQIYTANLGEIQLWPEFIFQVLYFNYGNSAPKDPLQVVKKFKAKDFSGSKKEVKSINKYAWLLQLDEPVPTIDPQKLKESFFRGAAEQPVVAKPFPEVDLHIEQLRDDYQFLDQSEIVNIQLAHFKKAFDAAIVHQMPSIVFIHGVGNGTLRHHILLHG